MMSIRTILCPTPILGSDHSSDSHKGFGSRDPTDDQSGTGHVKRTGDGDLSWSIALLHKRRVKCMCAINKAGFNVHHKPSPNLLKRKVCSLASRSNFEEDGFALNGLTITD